MEVFGTKSVKLIEYVDRVANYLGLYDLDAYVEVNIVKECDQGAGGYCHGDDEDIEIEIARYDRCGKLNQKQMMINIAHEMIHALQIASGRLVNTGFIMRDVGNERELAYAHTWEGERFVNMPYDDQPWEIEAYAREMEVFEACV